MTGNNDPAATSGSTQCNDGTTNPSSGTFTSYNILVRGDFVGSGTASVSAGSVQVTANHRFHRHNRNAQRLLPMVNQRFTGTGNVMGQSIVLSGRVDPADSSASKGSVLRSPRLVATFSTSTHRFGRIAGQPGATQSSPTPSGPTPSGPTQSGDGR